MIKNSSKRTGSAHLIIIAIIVLVLLGALGFVFWKRLNTPNKPQTSSDKTALTKQTTTPDYITLADWGVTFKVADELKSTQVTYMKKQSADGSSYAFTTKRIHDLGGSCAAEPFGGTQILTRSTEKPVATPDGELLNDPAIDGYYYALSTPLAPCSIVDKNGDLLQGAKVSSTEKNDRSALKSTLESIQSKDIEVSSGYLTLKDWGVKFKIPEGLTDVKAYKYSFPENSEGFSNSYYQLTTGRVEALGQWCSAITEGNNRVTRLGSISRSTQKQDEYVSAAPANDNKPVGGYYYYTSGGQATCSDEGNDLQLQDLRAINDMLMHPIAE